MLTLVPWLLQRPGATVQEAAEAFGVGEGAIRRDLYHLDFCGLPGLGGGDLFEIHLVEDQVVVRMADELRRPLRLTAHEALRLVLTGEAVSAALGDVLPGLRSALDKVRAAVGVPPGVRVQIEEDGVHWLPTVREALERGRQLRLRYRGRADEEPVERTVDPWALHVADGQWYLQGRDHGVGDLRTFRLDRMAEARILPEAREAPPPEGSLPPPRYAAGPDDVEVELAVPPRAGWVSEWVVADEVSDLEEGWRRVRFRTDALPWVVQLLLVAGPEVEVRRPPELARDLAAEADRALRRYRGR